MRDFFMPFINSIKILGISLLVAVLAGCAGTRTVDPETARANLQNSNFKAYAQKYVDSKGNPTYDKTSLLDTLEAAKAFNDAGMWALSREAFNASSSMMMWKEDTVLTPAGITTLVGTTLTNDTLAPYTGKIFQGGMIDYYQAMNSLMMGDEAAARVNFNRVAVRQNNAVTQLEAFAKSTDESIKEGFGQQGSESAQKSLVNIAPKLADGKQDLPSGLSKAKIRNATADVMSSVFRSTSGAGQADKGGNLPVSLLRNAGTAASSQGGAALVRQLTNDLQVGRGEIKNKVIVIYEDGIGPGFSEFRIDLPLFLVSSTVTYSGIALPKFKAGTPAFGSIKLGPTGASTVVMTNMNELAGLEFDAAYRGIVAKAILSTIIKTVAQAAVNTAVDRQVGNSLLGTLLKVGTGAAQAALTRADTRAWTNLPNTIQVGYIERPANGSLQITTANGNPVGSVQLENAPNNLVVIKASGTGGKPAVYTQSLPVLRPALGT
jgi:hypothetical protein